jgi:hypothetical protein
MLVLASIAGVIVGSLLGMLIRRNWAKRPRTVIDEEGNWETVQGGRVPMFCPMCGWPRQYSLELPTITCEKCKYTGAPAEFDKKVVRAQ